MTLQEALNNIDVIISNTRMTRPEHDALKESENLIITHIKDLEEKIKLQDNKDE